MNKLLAVLLASAFATTTAYAADAPKAEAKADAKPAASGGELVTPQSDRAAMKDYIAKRKVESDAAKAKAGEAKK